MPSSFGDNQEEGIRMNEIVICAGSCCHHRCDDELIPSIQKLISDNNLEEKIQLKASFCMGQCGEGFNIKINGKIHNFLSMKECMDYLIKTFLQEGNNAE